MKVSFLVTVLQWIPVNMDTKGTDQIVRINGVSVLSGFSEKKVTDTCSRCEDEGKCFYGDKMLFNCTVTVTDENCALND